MNDKPHNPDDLEWKRVMEADMTDFKAAMVGDFKNPTGMMQNMLRVMNTLYHEEDGVIVKQSRYQMATDKRLLKYDRLLYIGAGIILTINILPTVIGWIQKLMAVKP